MHLRKPRIIPDCRSKMCSIRSSFVHTLRDDVHESVHRDTIVKITNKMQLYRLTYYSKSALHVSDDVFAHHQEHLTLFTVSGSIHPSCCRLVYWMNWNWTMWIVRSVYWTMWIVRRVYWTMWIVWGVYTPHSPHSSVSTRPRHQPAATLVNTATYCKYSQVFLMLGENIARNT
jgi:hypothetical protein